MITANQKILIGKAGDQEVILEPSLLNRHGLIAGSTGTGKTVTLKVIAESLADLGVPTVIADIKGDLTGMLEEGDLTGIQERLDSMSISGFTTKRYPVHFYDVFQKNGHPVRAQVQKMSSILLSRILDLTDAQEGVLNIIFKVAKDMNLGLYDLKDLQVMTTYVGEHAKDLTLTYGNVSKQSVGAIQRKLLQLEEEGGDLFFGMPSLDIDDWMVKEGNSGVMNILECEELFKHPSLYAVFLYWMLQEIYDRLEEVGDLPLPKIVFFFDEAHALFDIANKELLEKIEQTVKLIRSKGVGIFFITQSPSDIPDCILAQLSNRIQHSLRAYTPSEIKTVKLAAQSFRENPDLDTVEEITSMKTGTALVSVLDQDGAPTMVQKTKILPPRSSMKMADESAINRCIENDSIFGKYEKAVDPDSAFEEIDHIKEEEAKAEEEAKKAKEEEKEKLRKERQEEREKEREEKRKADWSKRMSRKVTNRIENEIVNSGMRSAKKLLKSFFK